MTTFEVVWDCRDGIDGYGKNIEVSLLRKS